MYQTGDWTSSDGYHQLGGLAAADVLDRLTNALKCLPADAPGRWDIESASSLVAEWLEGQRRQTDLLWGVPYLPEIEARLHARRDVAIPKWLRDARREPDGTWVGADPDNPEVLIEVGPSGYWSLRIEDQDPGCSRGYVALCAYLTGRRIDEVAAQLARQMKLGEGDHV